MPFPSIIIPLRRRPARFTQFFLHRDADYAPVVNKLDSILDEIKSGEDFSAHLPALVAVFRRLFPYPNWQLIQTGTYRTSALHVKRLTSRSSPLRLLPPLPAPYLFISGLAPACLTELPPAAVLPLLTAVNPPETISLLGVLFNHMSFPKREVKEATGQVCCDP